MILTKDNYKVGLILGIVAPILGFIIYYFAKFSGAFTFGEYIEILLDKQYRPLLTTISSISLLINAVIFTAYINTHRDRTAKGIFFVTCFYALFVILLKVIFK